MTTLWADGFDSTSATDLAYDYTRTDINGLVVAAGRRAGGNSLKIGDSYKTSLIRLLPSSASTIFVSMAISIEARTGESTLFRLLEAGAVHISVAAEVSASGAYLRFYRGDINGTTLGNSATNGLPLGTWIWVQAKIVIHDTAGSIEVRDSVGNVIVNLTSIDTRNGGSGVVDSVSLGGSLYYSVPALWIDDWHVWDSTGSICNTFTTETRIDALYPNAAGDVTQFTPSTGSNWDCVNENPASTTDYVSNATAGNQDLYQFTDLPHTPVNIYGVLRSALASKDDAGARSLKLLAKSGSTVNTGSAVALNFGSWARQYDVLEADPNTSAAWTPAGVNSAQFGVQTL